MLDVRCSMFNLLFKKACPGEVRGRNPEGVFFSDPWLRGTGKRGEGRIKAINRGWKPLPQAGSYPSSRFWVQSLVVLGSEFWVQCSGFRVQSSEFKGSRLKVKRL